MDNSKNSLAISICLGVFLTMIIAVGLVKFFPVYLFNKMDCNTFSIDQVELRTGINVPKIKSMDCECNGNNKNVNFVIDDSKVDIDDYLSKHHFLYKENVLVDEFENDFSKFKATFNPINNEVSIEVFYLGNKSYF